MWLESTCKLFFLWLLLAAKTYEVQVLNVTTFNITCDPHNESNCQSESLETVVAQIRNGSDRGIQINIKIPQLKLTTNINFTNLSTLIINGDPTMTTIMCTANANDTTSAGIVLWNITHKIMMKSLHFVFCGSQTTNTFNTSKTYSSAISMLYCWNVELNKIIIKSSKGVGLSFLYHQGGKVNIISATFKDNKLPKELLKSGSVQGGGGVSITLHLPTVFRFEKCLFVNNTSHTMKYSIGYIDDFGEMKVGFGRGGGVHLSIISGANITVTFLECRFIGNQAFVGGGLSVKVHGEFDQIDIRNVTVNVQDSLFEHNGCNHTQDHTYIGGGIDLSFDTDHGTATITHSHYLLTNVSFIENCAELGGGVFYYSNRDTQGVIDNINNSMVFDNCIFERNGAHIGSAVEMVPSMFFKLTTGYTITPIFKDCYFSHNFVYVNHSNSQLIQKTPGIGTVYASLNNIHFRGHNHFENNTGTAIYMINGVIDCRNSSMTFINNTGIQGGALALIGSSIMNVGPNNYKFINNTAIHQGGAIYVVLTDITDFITSRSCFIQYYDKHGCTLSANWKANITFIGNKAKDDTAGNAIYATSFHPCQVINEGNIKEPEYKFINNISEVFSVRGIKFDDDPLCPQIATDGALFHTSRPAPLVIIPGEKYHHKVTMTDDLGHLVNAFLSVAIIESTGISSGYYTLTGGEIELKGQPGHNATLFMYTVSPRQKYIKMDVELAKCPPGFKLNQTSLVCVCNAEAYSGLFKCDADTFQSYLHPGYWAGLMKTHSNKQELVISFCLFCDYSLSMANESDLEFVPLPQDYSKLSETVCGRSRTGIVCSMCQDNYTIHFHSPAYQCKPEGPSGCGWGWVFYILSELVPVTLVFIIVLGFNISFTSGTINGFILFIQLFQSLDVHASGTIVLPESIKHEIYDWTQSYQMIYGIFNLNFFNSESLSFCLWKGASALDMYAVKYVTILYTLLLIVAVIWIMKSCGGKCFGKFCRITSVKTSIIHGISTFLVISYAQCVKISLLLLMPANFSTDETTGFIPPARVWLNGELAYFSKGHLPYAIPAVFCLLTIGLFPPALLLAYPLLNKVLAAFGCENVSLISHQISISSLKPLLDSIQGCFKDNFRFFAGLYFMYRWIILVIFMSPGVFGSYYTIVSAVLLFILTLHTICQPYTKRLHNITDTLLFANLLLINFLTSFNYISSRGHQKSKAKHGPMVLSSAVQLMLIYLPLVVMGVYILIALCKNIVKRGCEKLLVTILPKKANALKELVLGSSVNDEDELIHDRLLDIHINYPNYLSTNDNNSVQ